MGLKEQQNFLAKLYTNENFRKKFVEHPEIIGKEQKLSDEQIKEILLILPDEIESFAESLFHKRLREVQKYLPLTTINLGAESERYFRDFIKNFNTNAVNKHIIDAIEFVKHLIGQANLNSLTKDIARYEQAKLEFNGTGKYFIFKKLLFDPRKIDHADNPLANELELKKTILIWMKIGKFRKQIYL